MVGSDWLEDIVEEWEGRIDGIYIITIAFRERQNKLNTHTQF